MILPVLVIFIRLIEGSSLVRGAEQQARLMTHSWQWYQVTSGMEDPAFDWQQPSWTKRCHLMLFNGTHLSPELQKVAIANKRLIDYYISVPEVKLGRRRRKRAVQVEAGLKERDGISYKTGDLKWGVKKTSFSQTKPVKSSASGGQFIRRAPAKSRYFHSSFPFLPQEIHPLGFIQSQSTSAFQPEVFAPTVVAIEPESQMKGDTSEPSNLPELRQLASDLKLNQDIFAVNLNVAMFRIVEIRKLVRRLVEQLEKEEDSVTERKLERTTWVPSLNSLQQEAGKSDLRELYSNLSHYIQYFSVNAEQMVYDQLVEPYRLDRSLPTNLQAGVDNQHCDIQFIVNDLDHLENIRSKFEKLNLNRSKLSGDSLKIYNILTSRFDALYYKGKRLESPLWNSKAADSSSGHMNSLKDSIKRKLVFVGRDVMPFDWRHPSSAHTRLSRDLATYEEYAKVLDYAYRLAEDLKVKVDQGVEQLKSYKGT